MKRKLLVFIGCFLVVALFAPTIVRASQTTRTLQPGRTYEFVGTDARVISHININGAGRYQFVETNALGELQRFGISNWRISVSGTGRVAVTPLAPMSVTFDSNRLSIIQSEGSVLRQVEVAAGQTISFQNTALTGRHVRIAQAAGITYDFVITNHFGDVENFGFGVRFPQVNIVGGGTKAITARGGAATVYFPSMWYGSDIIISAPNQTALATHAVVSGQELSIANLGSSVVTLNAQTAHAGVTFQYRFIMRGRDGHVTDYGNVSSNQIRIPGHHTLHLTPITGGELIFPTTLLSSISIDQDSAAPMYYTLRTGNSIVITNSDTLRTHSVFLRCAVDSASFSFDYTREIGDDITFGVFEDIIAPRHVFNLPAGVSVTITPTSGTLIVNTPDINEIEANIVSGAVLNRHLMLPGTSAYITNDSGYAIDIMSVADESLFGLDFVRYNLETGDIVAFGRMDLQRHFTIYEGQSVLLTSPDYTITLITPLAFADNGLTIAASDRTALFRQSLVHGDALRVENIDRLYHQSFLVEDDATGRTRLMGFAYDFVIDSNHGILGYGMSNLGHQAVPLGSRVILAPRIGRELSVVFPAEWYGRYLRVREYATQPLHNMVLTPGSQITFHNSSNVGAVISNNSQGTAAGFHTRVGHSGTPINVNTDTPQSGDIIVPPGASVTLVAALGADLEIRMPRSVARQLRLV